MYVYVYVYTPESDQHQITPYRITPDIHHIGSKV